MKKAYNYSLGFYSDDIFLEYTKFNNVELEPLKQSKKGFVQLLYIISGEYIITAGDKKYSAHSGALIISDFESNFDFWRKSHSAERLEIYFHKSVLGAFDEFDIYKVFHILPSGSCIYPEKFDCKICYDTLESIEKSLALRLNRFYILTKIQTIISELTLNCTNIGTQKTDENNTAVAVVEYVKANFIENITYDSIKKKFFICDSTINKIFRTMTGLTMNKYINQLRLNYAKTLINDEHNYLSLKSIAELSGFRTYSTFYREYVKKYKISPTSAGFNCRVSHFPLK